MDTKAVAEFLNCTPRVLRQFLRSDYSTFSSVGSGSRYEISERELPIVAKRFGEWHGAGKPKPSGEFKKPLKLSDVLADNKRQQQDEAEWAMEGPVHIEDIRNPRVRARVKAAAKAQEDRLNALLIARGMHVSQRVAS